MKAVKLEASACQGREIMTTITWSTVVTSICAHFMNRHPYKLYNAAELILIAAKNVLYNTL